MGNLLQYSPARGYEDLPSLKKFIKSAHTRLYNANTLNEIQINGEQTTTGTAAEFELGADASVPVAQIGKTEVTLVLSAAGDDASHNTKVFTLVYNDADGVSHTTTATGTAGLNATPVAFDPAASDVYSVESFTASADFDNQDVYAKVAAGATYATITAAGTVVAATEAQMFGVGTIYIKGSADHADSDAKVAYISYVTPWGEIKYGIGTLGADSDEEVAFLEATDDGDGTTTVVTGNYQVNDFYRLRWWNMSAAATANSYFTIGDADHNSNGGGGDVYAVLPNGSQSFWSFRHFALPDYSTWIGQIFAFASEYTAATYYKYNIVFTPKDQALARTLTLTFNGCIQYNTPLEVEPGTDIYVTIIDEGQATSLCSQMIIVEVEDI